MARGEALPYHTEERIGIPYPLHPTGTLPSRARSPGISAAELSKIPAEEILHPHYERELSRCKWHAVRDVVARSRRLPRLRDREPRTLLADSPRADTGPRKQISRPVDSWIAGGIPVHESRVISVENGIEPRACFKGASVDQTDACYLVSLRRSRERPDRSRRSCPGPGRQGAVAAPPDGHVFLELRVVRRVEREVSGCWAARGGTGGAGGRDLNSRWRAR